MDCTSNLGVAGPHELFGDHNNVTVLPFFHEQNHVLYILVTPYLSL